MIELSILIPSRNEQFLSRTIQDILDHSNHDLTEIIAVLDGQWADPPIDDHPNVTLVYVPVAIGQRAACNVAAKLARGRYVMKVDAHTAFAPGFDDVLLEDIQPDMTIVPIMRNLHVFNWICPNSHRRYQGQSGPCEECGEPTTMEMVWNPKPSPQSKSYCFDSEPHFQYFGEFNHRPEGQGDLTETMSLQGSCWMLSKEKYFELVVCDEAWGMWGSQGIEVACKTWLSGGRVVVDHRTWHAHCFRTKGGDFGFPYQLSGRQVENAKKIARDLFFENKWPQQIYPLSWLVEKFWPVKGWSDEDLAILRMKPFPHPDLLNNFVPVGSIVGSLVSDVADGASSRLPIDLCGKEMSVGTVGLPSVDSADRSLSDEHVLPVKNEPQMERVAAGGIVANVVQGGVIASSPVVGERLDKPGVDQSVSKGNIPHETNVSVAEPIASAVPDPALPNGVNGINVDPRENSGDVATRQMEGFREILTGSHLEPPSQVSRLESERATTRSDSIILSHAENVSNIKASGENSNLESPVWYTNHVVRQLKGVVYYTDNRLDPLIMNACQSQLKASVDGHKIVSVSLSALDFGENIVLERTRGYLTMFEQILAGLEALDCEIAFLAEHDILYHPSHFEFIPPDYTKVYYNLNWYKVRLSDGHALRYDSRQQSQLCANRDLLVEHYRRRVARTREKLDELGDTREYRDWIRRQGFEVGTHGRAERVDDLQSDVWMSPYPNIDIRHDANLTPSRWRQDQFRNHRSCGNWQEADEIPFWGKWADIVRSWNK